jgi:hypothetical protein
MRYYDGIVFETAHFPLSRLNAVQDALDGVMAKFQIESTGINEIANRVDISLFDSTKQQSIVEFLKTVFNDFDDRCVTFSGPFGISLTADLTTNTNSSFNPPVSMYQALQLALEGRGFNNTSISGNNIDARLVTMQTATNGTFISQNSLASIPSDYSAVIENGVVNRYVWVITISYPRSPGSMISCIDASTGEIVPIFVYRR